MKFLVVVACALAVASAGHVASPLVYSAYHGYHGAQHLPIIDHEGVPVDTADVQIARAAHLTHKVNVAARNGDLTVHAPVVIAHAAPVVDAHHSVVAHGSPVLAYGAHHSHGLLYRKRRGVIAAPIAYHGYHAYHGAQHLPIIDHEGVPVDTADVQIARAAHLTHKVNVAARNGDLAVHAPVVVADAVSSAYSVHGGVYGHHHAYSAPYAHYY